MICPTSELPSTAVQLRPYQLDAIARLDERVARGARRILLVAATGAGKTILASSIIVRAVCSGQRVLFLAHRRELINQAYRKLLDFGLPAPSVGVLMASDPRRRPGAPVQVASVDTLRNRAKPGADLVFIDEAHRALSNSYVQIAADYPNALHIGLTATPYRADGKGLGDAYNELIVVASPRQLIDEGFLVEPRVFTIPHSKRPDLSKVKLSKGDYAPDALEKAVDRVGLVGNIVEHWLEHAQGIRTVAFAVSVAHSRHIVERFAAAGIAAEHLDGTTPTVERDGILSRLDTGEIMVVSNCGVLCLDAETQILTTAGWIGIDDMTASHQVAAWKDGVVEFERPVAIHRRERMPGERMVELDGRSANLRVTEGHAIVYRASGEHPWRKRPARESIARQFEIPACGVAAPLPVDMEPKPVWTRRAIRKAISHTRWNVRHLEGYSEDAARSEATWRVMRSITRERTPPDDLTLAECAFIGFWLGDGNISRLISGGVEYRLFESSRNAFIVDWLDKLVEQLDVSFIKRTLMPHEKSAEVKYRRTAPAFCWSFPRGTGGGSQARDGLYSIEPYLERDGTWLYWGLSGQQFDALLHGFWMSDGNHRSGSNELPKAFIIHNARRALLDKIQAIASCRGYRTRLVPEQKDGMWRLSLNRRDHFTLGGEQLHFDQSEQPERVWCVTTRLGNIVTRRKGTVAVVGNCEGWDQPSVKCAILARPTKSTGLYLQQAGRILRPWQDHPAIILDHGGCALEHGLPQDTREFSLEGRKKKLSTTVESPVRECPSCNAVVGINTRICPACGYQLVAERELPEEEAGKLVEVQAEAWTPKPKPAANSAFRAAVEALRTAARSGGKLSWEDLDRSRGPGPPGAQQSLPFE